MANRAIEGLIVKQFGTDVWEEIKIKAEFDESGFIGMKTYPDSLTYKLVMAASDVTKISPELLLEAFGEYWILYRAGESNPHDI